MGDYTTDGVLEFFSDAPVANLLIFAVFILLIFAGNLFVNYQSTKNNKELAKTITELDKNILYHTVLAKENSQANMQKLDYLQRTVDIIRDRTAEMQGGDKSGDEK